MTRFVSMPPGYKPTDRVQLKCWQKRVHTVSVREACRIVRGKVSPTPRNNTGGHFVIISDQQCIDNNLCNCGKASGRQ